jgi:hypothetical protein
MRSLLAALCTTLCFASTSFAQCYGDAAAAFGCGVSRGQEDTLESFGDSRNQVIPDYGYSRPISAADIFSTQETVGFYRRIYTGWRNNRWSEQAFRNSMNAGSQPIRAFGNIPFTRPQF